MGTADVCWEVEIEAVARLNGTLTAKKKTSSREETIPPPGVPAVFVAFQWVRERVAVKLLSNSPVCRLPEPRNPCHSWCGQEDLNL